MKRKERSAIYDGDATTIDSAIPVIKRTNLLLKEQLPPLGLSVFGYEPKDLVGWDFLDHDILQRTGNIELEKTANSYWYNGDVLREAPPMRLSVPVVHILHFLNLYQAIVTSRDPKFGLTIPTKEWFGQHMPFFLDEGRIEIRKIGDERSGPQFKFDVVKEKKPGWFFDDDFKVIDYFKGRQEEIPNTRVRLFSQRWNESRKDLDNVRVTGWLQILALVLWGTNLPS